MESKYLDVIESDLCILVRGNSGVGKTWLTQWMMRKTKSQFVEINLATVKSYGTFNEYFKNNISDIINSYSEMKSANANAIAISGKLSHTNDYYIGHNFFVEFLKENQNSYIILDNLESIFGEEELIKELGCLITLMDDSVVREFNSKFIIIGTNTDIQRFFSELPNADTIDNRIRELPEVKGFSREECTNFVSTGFRKLGIEIPAYIDGAVNEKVYKLTCGIPQRVHELCRIIAKKHIEEEENTFSDAYWEISQKEWIADSFSKNYSFISNIFMNNLRTNPNYNCILFAIAEIDVLQFDHLKVWALLSTLFPTKDLGKITVKNQLKFLSDTKKNNNILNSYNDQFYIRDYKTVLCLRAMLYRENGIVKMYDIKEM